jgi:lipid-binding SYLF domain-containing protein
MKRYRCHFFMFACALALVFSSPVQADKYTDSLEVFKGSDAVKPLFEKAYGYAIFPTIGKAGIGIGGAYGQGQVVAKGKVTGTASLAKLSIGWQLGGQALSQLVLFEDKRAYEEFTSGSFEFDAAASAVAITASAQASAGTEGASAGAGAGPKTGAQASAGYHKGMAVFVHAKGGLMYEASIGGQKFTFKPKE